MERQRLEETLPVRMNSMERFCAALLRSSAADFAQSESSSSQSWALWQTICRRVGLTALDSPLAPCYDQASHLHFQTRAALVLEEARFALAQPLAARWNRPPAPNRTATYNGLSMILSAHCVEKPNNHQSNCHGHSKVVLQKKDAPFTREELYHLRTAAVLECFVRDGGPRKVTAVHLGVIFSSQREQIETKREFAVTFFRPLPSSWQAAGSGGGVELVVRPLETLVTQLRSFEAVMMRPERIAFLHPLLGKPSAVHTRFPHNDDDDGEENHNNDNHHYAKISSSGSSTQSNNIHSQMAALKAMLDGPSSATATTNGPQSSTTSSSSRGIFRLPTLNATQEKAAATFLQSKPNTLTLIQGPPGTGKSTLLVTLVARYLMESGDQKRILVCAPTNKAISVLATRFMECLDERRANFAPIMVGDAEKLLVDEKSSSGNSDSANKLRSILCYTWLPTLVEEYCSIRNYFAPKGDRRGTNPQKLYQLGLRLEKRIENGLYGLAEDFFQLANKVSTGLSVIQLGGSYDIVPVLSKLIKKLEDLQKTPQDSVWKLLLANANIIFCTCVSAG